MTMRNDETVFGAIAEIGIKFQGPIGDLAKLLEKAFLISIAVESSEWPPHNLVGTAEAIGMTLWLEQRTLGDGYDYFLRLDSEEMSQEILRGRTHDLSPWLAQYVRTTCDIQTRPMSLPKTP